ncbi:hypothetical protein A3A71_01385 [Candidatus Berkelbacteria bacterium RIFCSPLOWO2_01_FULL_50_28]|uniref:Uncharacterized protein n=1 Tax=Candidatus Berkelbacteria bacterium RIFCSPLOWO2_01_FULL_50_28 TaxID=1797471 RepID=A0A1F5EBL8_9BACT|nr:MAG: hypothetical protein A2807_01955 [Candidatus Berkelbacteria bacterium RIFCSPHIGHO2_01_FULL_50_36]OGD63999.1 MAG: hypothetical protein A3F39_02915 [Candidatus Berkelbacteria bacterium RIFCSPHIGHO2_12_FULL_50_11]OGD64690.1 MAG: hypothetical protein A3A71_01385 [Candidatus Berkelbacteria bacterium RIFCSPLOWO2_01_FULL_50_28]
MDTTTLIDTLAVVVLGLFAVALVYLIVLLHKLNTTVNRLSNIPELIYSFFERVVPAIVNVSTISTAVHGVLKSFLDHTTKAKSREKKG